MGTEKDGSFKNYGLCRQEKEDSFRSHALCGWEKEESFSNYALYGQEKEGFGQPHPLSARKERKLLGEGVSNPTLYEWEKERKSVLARMPYMGGTSKGICTLTMLGRENVVSERHTCQMIGYVSAYRPNQRSKPSYAMGIKKCMYRCAKWSIMWLFITWCCSCCYKVHTFLTETCSRWPAHVN